MRTQFQIFQNLNEIVRQNQKSTELSGKQKGARGRRINLDSAGEEALYNPGFRHDKLLLGFWQIPNSFGFGVCVKHREKKWCKSSSFASRWQSV
jgi:hypothetical protein